MTTATVTCARCLAAVPTGATTRFCPRCGWAVPPPNAAPVSMPVDVAVSGRVYRVLDRIGVGSRCLVYRCKVGGNRSDAEGTIKIARDPASNAAVAREAEVLRHLHSADAAGQFTPFVQTVLASFGYVGTRGEPPRHANVLRMDPAVHSPADDFYTLAEVRSAYPDGLDARDMAWVWRRVLTVLGFAHGCGVAHGAVLPVHLLIDPVDHKLVLIDWCAATLPHRPTVEARAAMPGGYWPWGAAESFPSAAGDLRLAARCMAELVGGDVAADRFPPACDPAVARHLSRVFNSTRPDAWRLRDEFDQLIEAAWGPRQFRPLTMPPRRMV